MPVDLLETRARTPRDLFAEGGGRDLLVEADAEVTPQEQAVAERPARMTVSRGGQPTLQPNDAPPDEPPSADWKDVASSLPAQFVAGTRSAAANLRQMGAQESVVQREEALRPVESDPSGWGAVVRPSAVGRQQGKLAEDRTALASAVADAGQARRDMRLVTPENMTIAQEALSSLAQSSGPTLLGIAAGILTRNIPAAMAIAGGGGMGMQAGSTYGEALGHGATHREASVAASIDGLLEAGDEMLPLSYALKAHTNLYARIFGTIAREAGQESASQLAQDLRAMAMENPGLKLGEVWRNVKVAALAGAGGGAVYGGMGAAANAAREHEAQKDARGAAMVRGVVEAQSVDEAVAVANAATQDALTPGATPMQIAIEQAMVAHAQRQAREDAIRAEEAAAAEVPVPATAAVTEAERSGQVELAAGPQTLAVPPAGAQPAQETIPEAIGGVVEAATAPEQRVSAPEASPAPQTAPAAPTATVQPPAHLAEPTPVRTAVAPASAPPAQQEAAPAPKNEFASTQVPLSEADSGRVMAAAKSIIAPEDLHQEKGLEDRPHITVKYGLHSADVDAVRNLVAGEPPARAKVTGIEIFQPADKDYDVVVARVDSADLVRLNAKIKESLPNTDTFPTYRPHITLGYVNRGMGKKYAEAKTGIEGEEITLDTLEVSDQDENITPIKLTGRQVTAPEFKPGAKPPHTPAPEQRTPEQIAEHEGS